MLAGHIGLSALFRARRARFRSHTQLTAKRAVSRKNLQKPCRASTLARLPPRLVPWWSTARSRCSAMAARTPPSVARVYDRCVASQTCSASATTSGPPRQSLESVGLVICSKACSHIHPMASYAHSQSLSSFSYDTASNLALAIGHDSPDVR